MSPTLVIVLAALVSYLIGSIPFGYVIARGVRGIDIRDHGSGNIGATNVGRVLGSKWGIAALLLDVVKALLPAWLLPLALVAPGPWRTHAAVVCGVAAILGHMYPIYLRLRGGKGVASALGVVAFLSPWGTLAAFAVFVLTFAISRIVSLSSMLACVAFAICQMLLLLPDPFSADHVSLAVFSLAVPALIIFRHRSNIGRLLRGEEPRYHTRVPPPAAPLPVNPAGTASGPADASR